MDSCIPNDIAYVSSFMHLLQHSMSSYISPRFRVSLQHSLDTYIQGFICLLSLSHDIMQIRHPTRNMVRTSVGKTCNHIGPIIRVITIETFHNNMYRSFTISYYLYLFIKGSLKGIVIIFHPSLALYLKHVLTVIHNVLN